LKSLIRRLRNEETHALLSTLIAEEGCIRLSLIFAVLPGYGLARIDLSGAGDD
jgi:hypothetical protein